MLSLLDSPLFAIEKAILAYVFPPPAAGFAPFVLNCTRISTEDLCGHVCQNLTATNQTNNTEGAPSFFRLSGIVTKLETYLVVFLSAVFHILPPVARLLYFVLEHWQFLCILVLSHYISWYLRRSNNFFCPQDNICSSCRAVQSYTYPADQQCTVVVSSDTCSTKS